MAPGKVRRLGDLHGEDLLKAMLIAVEEFNQAVERYQAAAAAFEYLADARRQAA